VVRGLLEANLHLVAALRDALLDRHELIGGEIVDVLEKAAAAGPKRTAIGDRTPDLTIDLRSAQHETTPDA
jgi:cell division protease FtsH